jgi:hypothetical protein
MLPMPEDTALNPSQIEPSSKGASSDKLQAKTSRTGLKSPICAETKPVNLAPRSKPNYQLRLQRLSAATRVNMLLLAVGLAPLPWLVLRQEIASPSTCLHEADFLK